ncbi:MAG: lytic transglycosylase domain-containing protein [Bacillota bacterium]|nr:lytic transglycosylase domain-containing protein [Bacillota bacterium]
MDLVEQATAVAREYGIPENIFLGLIKAESHWRPHAISLEGAIGLTQVMPATAWEMGYDPADLAADPYLQIEAGAKYFRSMYDMFGNWQDALAAYNAGPHNVQKYGGVPPFKGTRNFIQKVMQYADEYSSGMDED